uniref:CSON009829 protein n=1 Tax=Culicoides sonorensis TaxID=179676 RepID=A0A336KFD9_CULSO
MSNKPIPSSRTAAKSKLNLASELYALGSKAGSSRSSDEQKSGKTSSDRKRESGGSSSSALPASKKAKLSLPGLSGASSRSSSEGPSSASIEYWEQTVIECEPVDLVSSVLTAIDQQDSDTIIGLICGAIKFYANPRTKTDNLLYMDLVYLSKLRPHIFCNETVTQALVSVLKRDTQNAFKGKNNPSSHVLTCNLLARGHFDKKQWPEIFMKIYIEDAINERIWVDNEDCSVFVENIISAFGTKIPPKSMLQPELTALTPNKEPSSSNLDEESLESIPSGDSVKSGGIDSGNGDNTLQSRYSHCMTAVEKIVIDAIKEQLNRRQGPDATTRNFLKFLSSCMGIQEVRALCVTRIELWIHNSKLGKSAQELLMYLCYNITDVKDKEVLSNLVKIRLKTKPLINVFMTCFKEMINLQPEILSTLLKYVVQNELSNTRNPNNMGMLGNMFQVKSDASAKHLAEIYQEFLLQKEDCLRTLKVFLRELVKMLRYDINLAVFVKAFINIRPEIVVQIQTSEFRERIFSHMVDLICLSMFLSVSPHVKDAIMTLRSGRDLKDSPFLYTFYAQMCQMQCDVIGFMLEVVPSVFQPAANDFTVMLHKILLFDPPESYCKGDTWPQDGEKTFFVRATSEIPLHQDSILKLILIGIHKEIQFSVPDTMELIDQMVRRAGALKTVTNYPPLEANKLEIIDFLFSMSEYHHPDNIALPMGYEPPKLSISSLYWKTWTILLILSAHNTSTFGSFCWEQYPMLRNLIEMCITNQFVQAKPPDEELQIAAIEKQQILEFETHLAAATSKVMITEQTSLLLPQVMLMDPMGHPRHPPLHVLEQLTILNKSHKLGHLLCRSRKPDLLVDIIQRQGTSQSMPWLADLVKNSEGDFNHLPVQCLCEFLLSNPIGANNPREQELMLYLQNLLVDAEVETQTTCEVIEYFLRRLSSTSRQSRASAIRALKILLKVFDKADESIIETNDSEWLIRFLPLIPHFNIVRPLVIIQLRAACQIENNAELIMSYIQFIASNTLHDGVTDMFDHVMDMSQLIVERSTVFSQIIPALNEVHENKFNTLNCLFVMFNNFFVKLRESKNQTFAEYPELLLVHFSDGTQCSTHLSIIQAFVVLLTYSKDIPGVETILDYWFPINMPPPQAFTLETQEPVQILPDWLKLKMIRSNVERLVDVALQDLTPDQIVLFVQNFGTPVSSMSKLLALLDRAVIENCEIVNSAILNKPYLAQLIEIQQARGAKNGHISVHTLDLHGQTITEPVKGNNVSKIDEWVVNLKQNTSAIKSDTKQTAAKTNKEMEEVIEAILTRPVINKLTLQKFRKLVQQLSFKSNKSQVKTGLAQDMLVTKIFQYFVKMMKSQQGSYIFRNIIQNTTICTFFRALFAVDLEKSDQIAMQSQVIEDLLKYLNLQQHPILIQILLNKKKKLNLTRNVDEPITSSQNERQKTLSTVLTDISENKLAQDIASNRGDAPRLIKALTMGLQAVDVKIKSELGTIQRNTSDNRGLLVDWLAESDSELIRSHPELQMKLLFGEINHSFRPYLLSLSHQSSWSSLAKVVENLLASCNEKYDPTFVLDFIDALIRNPKLWQGRDRAVPKHEQIEYILELNENQIKSMIDYVLRENALKVNPEPKLSTRMHLLLHCSDIQKWNLVHLIKYVDSKQDSNVKVVKKQFLQHLYLNIPPIKFLPVKVDDVYDADLRKLNGCVADEFAHCITTAINSLSNPKDWQTLSGDMVLIVRKLAASHPSLLLRELPVLAGLLQGRAHMDMFVLRIEHHLALFHEVLGLLELMQPKIFEDCYQESFHAALECYFQFLRFHGHTKDVFSILYRLVDLLQAYTAANTNTALKFIETYADLLQEIASNNRSFYGLNQLIQGLSLLKHKHTKLETKIKSEDTEIKQEPGTSSIETDIKEDESHGTAAVILAPYNKPDIAPPHWSKLISTLKHNQVEDVLTTFEEIENITYKKPQLIEEIFDKILEYIFHPSSAIRNKAFTLLVRFMKYNPGNAAYNSSILTNYIQCLTSDDTSIVVSALEILTEVVLCLQEYASEILNTVFELGITSRVSAYSALRKCLLSLKTQQAC